MQGRVQDDVSKMKRLQPKHRKKKKKKKKKSPDRKKSLGHELGMSMQISGLLYFYPTSWKALALLVRGKKRKKERKSERTAEDKQRPYEYECV
jgi:hypothetical protein